VGVVWMLRNPILKLYFDKHKSKAVSSKLFWLATHFRVKKISRDTPKNFFEQIHSKIEIHDLFLGQVWKNW
jgi:hypothetical protein